MEKQVFLVIIPEHPTYELAKQIQKEVNQKYRLYQVLPELHVTLETITVKTEEEIDLIIRLIQENIYNFKPFLIKINGFACFDPPFKSVYLNVVKTDSLIQFYNQIHSCFKEFGLEVKEYPDGIQFHMTIASRILADREWSSDEYQQACQELKSFSVKSDFIFKSLELWNLDLDPKRRLLARFSFKENM